MRQSISLFLGILFFLTGCNQQLSVTVSDPVDYVNPYMGNISHLLVPAYPTVHLPNSMLRVYPERNDYTGDVLSGLPIVVTSHRGSSAFNLSPYRGDMEGLQPVVQYSYDNEKITPYSYSVYLDDYGIDVRFALSHQSAVYSLGFSGKENTFLVLNSRNGALRWDGTAVSGYQQLANNTKVYLYLETETEPQRVSSLQDGRQLDKHEASGRNANLVFHFSNETEQLNLRYGISFIDEEQAKQNLQREISDFDVDRTAEKGRKLWNEKLGKIIVKGGKDEDRKVFYTSLYRTYERPVCISEGGRYFSAFDGMVHNDNGTPFYTDDWIWDTYRATHPLRVLTEPAMEVNILHSFLRMSEQMPEFWWPTFPEITGDSRRMNSNHGIATVLDAYRKGLVGLDLERKYPAMRNALVKKTLAPWSAKPAGELDQFYQEHGYIPALRDGEQETIPEVHSWEKRQPVAVTLGTAYDEWCLAQIAKELGKTDDYKHFLQKSYNYRHLFNPETNFFHPRDKEGNFIEPFDYKFSGGMGAREYYGENNAWVYRWDVPHNVADLIHLMGGRENFLSYLDQTFSEPLGKSKFEFYSQLPDHTGNVGQFSMANEPSLHIPYLYNYAGAPWKTQKRIRKLVSEWFRNDLMGIPGDEDGGGMSAFVVFSQMGFYPVTPGSPAYNIGSPFFKEITVQLDNGKIFRIIAENNSPENKYIQSARLNGKEWNKPWFSHDDIKEGGILKLVMDSKANKKWGTASEDAPPSEGVLK
ncbi:MAG: GH92 family glycosyl hydrolase [Proteiniphilum sp.]|jgi:predicted alpha-1,2-mannosidase|nr:GH92 family glycosyl hydrolase [Proteiniphilum sp.]